jgi:signal transduction histidine kinase
MLIVIVTLYFKANNMKPQELILELNIAIIIVTSDNWQVKQYNQKAQQWLGMKLEIGKSFPHIFNNINKKALKRKLSKGRVASFDFELPKQELVVEFTCRYTEQVEDSVIIEGIPLTRAQSAEIMLASYSVMIEEKTRELEAALQSRDNFLATMSHELRTPLNLMIGFCESLLDSIYGELSKEQKYILEQMYMSGQNLFSLINNLLQLSRLRSGKLELNLKPINVGDLCQRVITELEELAELKHIEISFQNHSESVVQVDEQWCEHMISNLLSNALKFTDEHKRVGITVNEDDSYLRITVWDEGIGIPQRYHSKIFQPFTQVESSLARSFEGSGLGLSLVNEIVKLHCGHISVESNLNKGSKFYLDLPIISDRVDSLT